VSVCCDYGHVLRSCRLVMNQITHPLWCIYICWCGQNWIGFRLGDTLTCFTLLIISATVEASLQIGFQERHVKSTPNVTLNRLLILIFDILDIMCSTNCYEWRNEWIRNQYASLPRQCNTGRPLEQFGRNFVLLMVSEVCSLMQNFNV